MDINFDIKVQRINRIFASGSTKAYVDLNINDVILIKGLRIVQAKHGLFVAMPMERGKDNRWYENVRCLRSEIRKLITKTVMEAYEKENIA